MSTFAALQAKHDRAMPRDDWHQQAIDELWEECAAEYVAANWNYVLDGEGVQDLITRASKSLDSGISNERVMDLGRDLRSIVRRFTSDHATKIEAMCIARREQQRKEARDMARGWE